MASRLEADRTGSINAADNRLRPALRSLSRGPGPAGTEQDDPLVELARLVSRRPQAETPPPSPPPAEAPPPAAESDLSADLEAELLSTLEASLAEALAAENYPAGEPSAPSAAQRTAAAISAGRIEQDRPPYCTQAVGCAVKVWEAAD